MLKQRVLLKRWPFGAIGCFWMPHAGCGLFLYWPKAMHPKRLSSWLRPHKADCDRASVGCTASEVRITMIYTHHTSDWKVNRNIQISAESISPPPRRRMLLHHPAETRRVCLSAKCWMPTLLLQQNWFANWTVSNAFTLSFHNSDHMAVRTFIAKEIALQTT